MRWHDRILIIYTIIGIAGICLLAFLIDAYWGQGQVG